MINQQLGGVVNDDHGSAMSEDYRNVGGLNLRKLSFRITDQNGKLMNFYDIPIEFSLLFASPNYLYIYIFKDVMTIYAI